MYYIEFSRKPITAQPSEEILEFYSTETINYDHIVYLRSQHNITSYKYVHLTKTWQFLWSEELFEGEGDFSLSRYPWSVFKKILPDADIIVLRYPDGIRFYKADSVQLTLKLLKENGDFHEGYEQNLAWGNIFHNNDWWFGLMVKDQHGNIEFNVATHESIQSGEDEDCLLVLEKELDIPVAWKSTDVKFYVTKLRQDKPDVIVSQSENGLEFYQLGITFLVERIADVPQITFGVEGSLLFGNITQQIYQDILQVNVDKLLIYQYDSEVKNYKLLYSSNDSKKAKDWSFSNSTIKLFDINSDGQDDLIYTSYKGVTALRFNNKLNEWETLLDPSDIHDKNRYGHIVGSLHSTVQSLVLIQNAEGELVWGDFVLHKTEMEEEKKSSTVLVTPTSLANIVPTYSNMSLSRKITVRWAEQFDVSFLKKSINIMNGQINLNVPLIDTFLHEYEITMDLTYSSLNNSTNIFGVGWSLPIVDDYIFVDWNESVFLDDVVYYWIIQGQANELILTGISGEVYTFKLEDMDFTINYYKQEEYWIIEDKRERLIFGKQHGQDALHKTPTWPYWRGTGTDKKSQVHLASDWYLNCKSDKITGQNLYYYYEINEKPKTIRLISITDGDELQIAFKYTDQYSPKNYYLKTYAINTSMHSQVIEFEYERKAEIRYLISISQRLFTYEEPLLRFEYDTESGGNLLRTCVAPSHGLTVNYKFNTVLIPDAVRNKTVFPVGKHFEIFYGLQYAIIAYIKSRELNLRITDRQMSYTIRECNKESNFTCPYISSSDKYEVQTYEKCFLNLVKTNNKKELYTFQLDKVWISKKNYSFSKSTLFHISSKLAVAAEAKNLWILDPEDMKVETVDIPRPIRFITSHNKLVFGYDNSQLFVYHKPLNHKAWKRTLIETSEMPSLTRKTLNKFEFSSKLRSEALERLSRNNFQVSNNMIVIKGLQEKNERLECRIELFLLKEDYTIAKKKSIEINREVINDLKWQTQFDDKELVYDIGYVKENGLYKIKVKNVSGSKIDNYSNKERPNKIKEHINYANSAKYSERLKGTTLHRWHLYDIQLIQQGVYCGLDIFFNITGVDWKKESVNLKKRTTNQLEENLKLEPVGDKGYKLYNKNQVIAEIHGLLVNRFPIYIAFQKNETAEIITFKNNKVDQLSTFNKERLLKESDFANLLTVPTGTPNEIKVRPLSTIMSPMPKVRTVLSTMNLTDGNTYRITRYERYFELGKKTFTETIIQIPGVDNGWCRYILTTSSVDGNITKKEHCFEESGVEVVTKPSKDEQEDDKKNTTKTGIILDRTEQMIISDFRPYTLANEMHAYYGFEIYETNSIWNLEHGKIIRKGFSFTGESYLELKTECENKSAFLEATFNPNNQNIIYLASCWMRCKKSIDINKHVQYFKAIIRTDTDEDVVTILGQAKRTSGDWMYLELPIKFRFLKRIYQDYAYYKFGIEISSTEVPKLKIILRIEAPLGDMVDVDHVRFSPLSYTFLATVYDSNSKKPIEIIKENGLVDRQIYNHLGFKMATVQDDGELVSFTSCSNSGKLTPYLKKLESAGTCLSFEPENGFYDNFESHTFMNHWQVNDKEAWKIAPGQLWHVNESLHQIKLNKDLLDSKDFAVSFFVSLQTLHSSISIRTLNFGTINLKTLTNDFSDLSLPDGSFVRHLPLSAEIIVLVLDSRIWIWINQVLLFDKATDMPDTCTWPTFIIETNGLVLFRNMLVMNRPSVNVEYRNAFGESTQKIFLVNSETIHVEEILYDDLGRSAITTKMTKIPILNNSALTYRNNFITNKYPKDKQSVWFTGRLDGEVNRFNKEDGGYAFKRTIYLQSPLERAGKVGLPGKEFSTEGPYSTTFSHNSGIFFLDHIFPFNDGFKQNVVYKPNQAIEVSIFDKQWNEVAQYVQVPGFDHLLTTFEYDEKNHLVKILPPNLHERLGTNRRITPYLLRDLDTPEATKFTHDDQGTLIKTSTPDSGVIEFSYNSMGLVQFRTFKNKHSQIVDIVYFRYNENGQLIESGLFPEKNLNRDLDNYLIPSDNIFQQFDYGENQLEPDLRARLKTIFTNQNGTRMMDSIKYNCNEQIVSRQTTTLFKDVDDDYLTDLEIEYAGGKLRKLIYPFSFEDEFFGLVHTYNKLDQLVGLGDDSDPYRFVTFTYTPSGQLETENHAWGSPKILTRKYRYNAPDFLINITDDYLIEELSYITGGYGQRGYGDGMVMRVTFNAIWAKSADHRLFKVHNISTNCLRVLKKMGYLTYDDKPRKTFYPEAETRLPLICPVQNIAKLIAQKQVPKYYGHRYAYGNHQELVKAKYFTEDTEDLIEPLQPDSFTIIPDITLQQSQDIWKILTNTSFIISDQRQGANSKVGKRRRSIFRHDQLNFDLKALNPKFVLFEKSIANLILEALSHRKGISLKTFVDAFLQWENLSSSSIFVSKFRNTGAEIGRMLFEKGYLSQLINSLDSNFQYVLRSYAQQLPDILKVLRHHWIYDLGQSAFDTQSYGIDANGNHEIFYTGFDNYHLYYKNNTNQVENIRTSTREFAMRHDSFGNVIQAHHRGISCIEYYLISNRPKRIVLVNGVSIHLFYNSQGERLLKRVWNSQGKLIHETHYLRDENGRVLMDRRTEFGSIRKEIVTAYIYGPKGIIGFIRNKEFYSTITDHAGSIRLIVKDNRVLIAYDYLPYGELMRFYCIQPQDHIFYRYTGQEWDEETGLYNFHARLYDPSIGRFYQPDPKEQYYSPYKFSGNSPISFVDPNGQLAFLLIPILVFIVKAIVVATSVYVSVAASNKSWNPLKWDFTDYNTYLAVGFGALAGTAAFGGLVMGIVGRLFSAAASNKSFNPFKWDWKDPNTWNALLFGSSAGGIKSGFKQLNKYGKKFSQAFKKVRGFKQQKALQYAFVATALAPVATVTYVSAYVSNNKKHIWDWDFKNPQTWWSLIGGAKTGLSWVNGACDITAGITKFFREGSFTRKALLKEINFEEVGKRIMMAYFYGAAANGGDIAVWRWKFREFSTYEGILNGAFFGRDIGNIRMRIVTAKFKLQPIKRSTFTKFKDKLYSFDVTKAIKAPYNYLRKVSESKKARDQCLKNNPEAKGKLENFFKNIDKKKIWESRKKIPSFLEKLMDLEMSTVVDTVLNYISEAIPTDESFVQCYKFGRDDTCRVRLTTKDKETLAKIYGPAFKLSPEEFLSKFSVAFDNSLPKNNLASLEPSLFAMLPPSTEKINKDNLQLKLTSIDLRGSKKFTLKSYEVSDNSETKDFYIKGYYLSINSKIIIDPINDPVDYIFISELRGGIVNVIYEEKVMTISYSQYYSDGDNAKSHKYYQKTLKWEDYAPDVNSSLNTLNKDIEVTAFFHRDENMNWNFISQRISYIKDKNGNMSDVNKYEMFGDLIVIPLDLQQLPRQRSLGQRPLEISSSANRPQFFTTGLLKQTSYAISSVLTLSKFSFPQLNSEPEINGESIPKENGQTLTEIGDIFFQNADKNSLLTWGVFLVRKWFGYRSPNVKKTDFTQSIHVELDIASYSVVEEYEEALLKCARECEIELEILKLFESSELHNRFVKVARKELISGQLKKIPALLQKVFLSHLNQMKLVTFKSHIENLMEKLNNEVPKLQDQLLSMDENWVFYEKNALNKNY